MKHKILIFAIVAVFVAQTVEAQQDSLPVLGPEEVEIRDSRPKFLWGVRFDSRFDNHENDALRYLAPAVSSKTFLSVRIAPTIGIGWGGKNGGKIDPATGLETASATHPHSLRAGATVTLDISRRMLKNPAEPLIYYNYHDDRFDLFAGKFERRNLIGAYSRAIYVGTLWFYDNVIDGFALQYHPVQGHLELVLDWNGMQTATERERFRILSAGEFAPVKSHAMRWFAMGYSFDLYHLASTLEGGEGVVDHFMVSPWVGVNFHNLGNAFQILSLQAGWLQTADRDRMGANRWLTPGGLTVDATIQKWNVGIKNRLYYGAPQMPLRTILGIPTASLIYAGDPFYSAIAATKIYNYTYIYWRPRIGHGVSLELSAGLHTDGKNVGFQQTAMVGVTLDGDFFKDTKKRSKK